MNIHVQGYDMEDAMIINKSSYERGFAHGSVYKSEVFILLLQFFTRLFNYYFFFSVCGFKEDEW